MKLPLRISAAALAALAVGQMGASAALTTVANSSADGAAYTLNNLLFGGVVDSANAAANRLDDSLDQTLNATTVTTLIVEVAGNRGKNQFGIYDPTDTNKKLSIYPGSAVAPVGSDPTTITYSGSSVSVGASSITLGGTTFGFYLKNEDTGATFYSEPSKNSGADHMVTFTKWTAASIGPFTGPNPDYSSAAISLSGFNRIIGWEDVALSSGDKDYNDMLIGITVVPEPSTYIAAALLGLPLAAGAIRRRMAKMS